jgi:hypothetical protein
VAILSHREKFLLTTSRRGCPPNRCGRGVAQRGSAASLMAGHSKPWRHCIKAPAAVEFLWWGRPARGTRRAAQTPASGIVRPHRTKPQRSGVGIALSHLCSFQLRSLTKRTDLRKVRIAILRNTLWPVRKGLCTSLASKRATGKAVARRKLPHLANGRIKAGKVDWIV